MRRALSPSPMPSSRIHLRPPRPDDADAFLAAVTASRRLHGRWVSPPKDGAAYLTYLERMRQPGQAAFLVLRRDDDALVGVVNLSHIVMGALRSAYLGYYAFAPQAGQGLMTEGLGAVCRHAFRVLKLHRVEANIQPDNRASLALAKRCGFRKEGFSPRYLKINGRWRDHERWAQLAD